MENTWRKNLPQIEIKSANAFYDKLHVLKNIELSIPYSSKEACLDASNKIDFSFKFPGAEINTYARCILKDTELDEDNLET